MYVSVLFISLLLVSSTVSDNEKVTHVLDKFIKETREKEVNRGVSMKILDKTKVKSCPNKLNTPN